MCSSGVPCIYARMIRSFFEEDQTATGKTHFYSWLIDDDGKEEKERHLEERFESYCMPMINEWEEKLFLSIMRVIGVMRESACRAEIARE